MVTSGSRDPLCDRPHPQPGLHAHEATLEGLKHTNGRTHSTGTFNATRTAPIARGGPSSTPQLPQPTLQAPIHHNPRPRAARVWVGGRASHTDGEIVRRRYPWIRKRMECSNHVTGAHAYHCSRFQCQKNSYLCLLRKHGLEKARRVDADDRSGAGR